ncbi:MAG TPA: DUF4386 domain-containing protein [Jatrophihabitans sp.]|jgi:hypothetical protein|uniref:DUF4386 domain-containing protein n=1 Tax=Jatrophihabitans sp. TaxID=1932789 RepID=UPI002E08FA38|nr:DUF4386 domain-containing protein [Jatrophihabitans sp.]
MTRDRRRAVVTGVLLILATGSSLSSAPFLAPLGASDYLTQVAAHSTRVEVGALLASIAALTAPAIAVALYPVVRRVGEARALGAVAFRVIEGMSYLASAMLVLSLVTLSRDYVSAGRPDTPDYRPVAGTVLSAYRVLGNVALLLAFAVGGLLYYLAFYEGRLVPRWLSGWGIVGVVLLFGAGVLVTLRVIAPESATQFALAAPIGVQEMVLAGWLIARGFAVAPSESNLSPAVGAGSAARTGGPEGREVDPRRPRLGHPDGAREPVPGVRHEPH